MPCKLNQKYEKLQRTEKINYLGKCLAQKCRYYYETAGTSVEKDLHDNITPIGNDRAWIRIFDPAYREVKRFRAHPPKHFIIEIFHDVLLELRDNNESLKEILAKKIMVTMAGLFTGDEGRDQVFHQDVADAQGTYMTIIFNFDLDGNSLDGSTIFSACKQTNPSSHQINCGLDNKFTINEDEGVMFGGQVWHYGKGAKKRVALMIMIKAESVDDPNIDSSWVDEYVQFNHRLHSANIWTEDKKIKIQNVMMPFTQDNKRQRMSSP